MRTPNATALFKSLNREGRFLFDIRNSDTQAIPLTFYKAVRRGNTLQSHLEKSPDQKILVC